MIQEWKGGSKDVECLKCGNTLRLLTAFPLKLQECPHCHAGSHYLRRIWPKGRKRERRGSG